MVDGQDIAILTLWLFREKLKIEPLLYAGMTKLELLRSLAMFYRACLLGRAGINAADFLTTLPLVMYNDDWDMLQELSVEFNEQSFPSV